MLLKYSLFVYKICRSDRITQRLRDRAELFMLIKCRSDQRHIAGGSIMQVVVKSVGICPAGTCTSQLCTPVIHGLYKCVIVSAHQFSHIFTDSICDLIG